LLGKSREVALNTDRTAKYEQWTKEYGSVFRVPLVFGTSSVVLCDLKAATHVHAKDTYTYVMMSTLRRYQQRVFGRNMLNTEGEEHKRLRRALTPAFSTATLRRLTNVFYDSAYKIKTHWDALYESDTEVTIDVQKWMNRMTLDTIGIAGFGHDFKTLDGQPSAIIEAFEAFAKVRQQSFTSQMVIFASTILPLFARLFPSTRGSLFEKLGAVTSGVARQMLEDEKKGKEINGAAHSVKETSILELLVKEESATRKTKLSNEEMKSHIDLFLIAGYETTAISLTWALIELARQLELQQKLREELQRFSSSDPTWDQMKSELPLLDAVVHETLRLHPPLRLITRVAADDDIVPLSAPIKTASGTTVDSIAISKGTMVTLPFELFNRSEELWGPDAKRFVPDRWLQEFNYPAKEIRGHRHLFTFSDGPKACIGKEFALAEFKAALSVLIRNFTFELPDGPDTKIESQLGILTRPKVAGEVGASVPMRVVQVAK
jgi:cytochrome P450